MAIKETTMSNQEDQAQARKRRIDLRAKKASDADEEESPSKRRRAGDDSSRKKQPLASIRGVKQHSRYVPEVPMSKEELSQWRKEARRVRNRESAAASRKKTRERIEELEGEVAKIQHKYAQALQRIMELEEGGSSSSFTPNKLRQDTLTSGYTVSPPSSAASTPQHQASTISPPLSPQESFMLPEAAEVPHNLSSSASHHHQEQQQHQQAIDMIFRPTAA